MSDINEMNVGPRWYVAHTYSGYENKVKASLEKIVENRGLGHLIFDIRIPVETVIEKNGDTEKEVESKIFPCYVLIKMVMTEESWHAVRNITGVTGFVGPGSRPTPLTEEEVEALNIDGKSRPCRAVGKGWRQRCGQQRTVRGLYRNGRGDFGRSENHYGAHQAWTP